MLLQALHSSIILPADPALHGRQGAFLNCLLTTSRYMSWYAGQMFWRLERTLSISSEVFSRRVQSLRSCLLLSIHF
jgi:hypothetical protein